MAAKICIGLNFSEVIQKKTLVPFPKSLPVTVFEINNIFHFNQNSEKSTFFRVLRGVILSTLCVQNLPEIALSLMVFEITPFHME